MQLVVQVSEEVAIRVQYAERLSLFPESFRQRRGHEQLAADIGVHVKQLCTLVSSEWGDVRSMCWSMCLG